MQPVRAGTRQFRLAEDAGWPRDVDRFRTVLDGRDRKGNGFVVDGTKNVSILNLTVRNYTGNGIFFNDSENYLAAKIEQARTNEAITSTIACQRRQARLKT